MTCPLSTEPLKLSGTLDFNSGSKDSKSDRHQGERKLAKSNKKKVTVELDLQTKCEGMSRTIDTLLTIYSLTIDTLLTTT